MSRSLIESLESRRMLSSAVQVIDGVLDIEGTTGADDVVVKRVDLFQAGVPTGDLFLVNFNGGSFTFDPNGIQSIHADMGAGNDSVIIAKNVKMSCTLIGARGNDTLEGGTRDDVLSGGAGDDLLFGGHGSGLDVMYAGPRNEQDYFGITRGDTMISGENLTVVALPPVIDLVDGRIVFINPFGTAQTNE